MVTISGKAPSFSCESFVNKTITQVSLDSFKDKYKILFFYPLTLHLGRNIAELIRIVDALKHGEVCPANWTEGEKAMKADQSGLIDYFG